MKRHSFSAFETQEEGRKLGETLALNSVISLFGDLGAGKTTFIKGLVQGVCGVSPDEVNSPTFTYLTIYKHVYHFDLYRLKNAEQFLALGFDDYFTADGICCIEWSERIESILPKHVIRVELIHAGENQREIIIS